MGSTKYDQRILNCFETEKWKNGKLNPEPDLLKTLQMISELEDN